jgi:signal transduction histidine kinase
MNAIESRDAVLANVAHDIRSPLATIALTATKLARITPDNDESVHSLDIIQRAAAQIEMLVRDLLEVASIEGGVLTLHVAPARVRVILEEVAELHRVQANVNGIALAVQACTDACIVTADRERIIELLGNLVGNALKFTPAGGTVTLSCRSDVDSVTILVEDTGVGIPPGEIEHVFERFWQGPEARGGGAGLGLAIAKGIVEAHRGSITVQSEVGRGTSFRVVFPVAAD